MKALAPNTILQNRYKIIHLIGKGGMGEVYLAVDERLGSAMALKRTTVGDDPMLAEAFEREARTLANLRHNVLPKVSDHFIENDQQYLVMEHISGEDLSQRLKENEKPFPLNWVMFWADQLLEALTYLHTNEPPIIHRDIKPQNLKLTDDNHIVLLDFGLSKNALGQTRVTTSGSVVGYTPHYAPMEQIRGTGTNARSDIYSLSATLYQLLTAAVPPDALTRADSLLAGLSDPLEPISKLNSEVPESISGIILRGMQLSQEKRPENAREMQKSLRRAFNEIQSSMAAQTLAFSREEIGEEIQKEFGKDTGKPEDAEKSESAKKSGNAEKSKDAPAFGDKTEVMADLPPLPGERKTGAESPESFSEPAANPVEPPIDANEPGMKTEVLPDNLFSVQEDVVTKDYAEKDYSTKDDFSAESSSAPKKNDPSPENFETKEEFDFDRAGRSGGGDDFATNENFSDEEFSQETGFSPEATVPLISIDSEKVYAEEGTGGEEFSDSFDVDESESSAAAAGFSAENKPSAAQVSPNAGKIDSDFDAVRAGSGSSGTASAAAAKSSNGKYLAILGGLGAVLFLILGTAFAFGWFYMYGGAAATSAEDANKEAAAPVDPPSEPTPEAAESPATADADSTDQTNSNEALGAEENSENTNSADPASEAGGKTVTQTKPAPASRKAPKPTPRVVQKKAPAAKSTPKPAPKKTPTKGGRTDIIQ